MMNGTVTITATDFVALPSNACICGIRLPRTKSENVSPSTDPVCMHVCSDDSIVCHSSYGRNTGSAVEIAMVNRWLPSECISVPMDMVSTIESSLLYPHKLVAEKLLESVHSVV